MLFYELSHVRGLSCQIWDEFFVGLYHAEELLEFVFVLGGVMCFMFSTFVGSGDIPFPDIIIPTTVFCLLR